jgi:hypothetical protein
VIAVTVASISATRNHPPGSDRQHNEFRAA